MAQYSKNQIAWSVLRITLAVLIAAHGWARFLGGGVEPFGAWLTLQGMPFGLVIAGAITSVEILGTPLLALGRFVFPVTALYSTIYTVGIVMVHAREGWFVVGAGRNGVEYSILLVVALLCVGLQYAPSRSKAP